MVLRDPVHLEPIQDSLRLHAPLQRDNDLSDGGLVDVLAAHLAQDGWLLEAPDPDRWYLRSPTELRCETTPTERVEGADVYPFMPQGEHGRRLRSLMNDVQMLAHEHANGAAARVNSIWPWGQGNWRSMPAAPGRPLAPGFAQHPYFRGVWRHWGMACGVPDDARSRLETGGGMVAIPELPRGVAGLVMLEKRWLGPLFASLSAGRIEAVSLVLHRGLCLRLTRRGLRRYWRRPRPLANTLPELATRTAA